MRTTLRNAAPRLIYFAIRAADCAGVLAKLTDRGMGGWYQPVLDIKPVMRGGAIAAVAMVNAPEIHLPRWSDVSRAPAGSDKIWKRFVDMVHRHEKGHHRDFGRVLEGTKREIEAVATLDRRGFDRMVREIYAKNHRLARHYHANAGNTRAAWRLLEKGPP